MKKRLASILTGILLAMCNIVIFRTIRETLIVVMALVIVSILCED